MVKNKVFTHIDPELQPVFEELRKREPIFHTAAFGQSVEDLECATAPDYWEVGASGRRYSREFILKTLAEGERVDAHAAGWLCHDFGLRRLGENCFLITYTLEQEGLFTRRATIWERTDSDWRILYHHGTVVTAIEDDSFPS